jgi:hypothetical protein
LSFAIWAMSSAVAGGPGGPPRRAGALVAGDIATAVVVFVVSAANARLKFNVAQSSAAPQVILTIFILTFHAPEESRSARQINNLLRTRDCDWQGILMVEAYSSKHAGRKRKYFPATSSQK